MLKSGHGLLKQAFVVSTILVLMISLLSVGMVRAAPPPRIFSIEIDGVVVGTFDTDGNKKGTSFSGGDTETLDLTAPVELSHYSLFDKGDFNLDGVPYTMGESGFGRDILTLRFNIYHPSAYWDGDGEPTKDDHREVFRLRIYLDVGGEKGPGCYEDEEATVQQVHTVWQWQEKGRFGKKSGWVLINEDHGRAISHLGYIEVDINGKCPVG